MLKRENRINLKKDFEKIFKTGKNSTGRLIGYKIVKKNTEKSRFGIIISKKISKRAVVRNRLKRQIRDIVEKEEKKLNQGFDLIMIPLKESLKADFSEIKEEIKEKLKNYKLY